VRSFCPPAPFPWCCQFRPCPPFCATCSSVLPQGDPARVPESSQCRALPQRCVHEWNGASRGTLRRLQEQSRGADGKTIRSGIPSSGSDGCSQVHPMHASCGVLHPSADRARAARPAGTPAASTYLSFRETPAGCRTGEVLLSVRGRPRADRSARQQVDPSQDELSGKIRKSLLRQRREWRYRLIGRDLQRSMDDIPAIQVDFFLRLTPGVPFDVVFDHCA
jgi:hypothetical protein